LGLAGAKGIKFLGVIAIRRDMDPEETDRIVGFVSVEYMSVAVSVWGSDVISRGGWWID